MLNVQLAKKLNHFTLDIAFTMRSEIIAICGPSGAGKTTILNSIAGLIRPDTGQIQLNNRTLFQTGKTNIPTRKRNIGYMFQDYALFPHRTVWKNITYKNNNTKLVELLLQELQIDHLKEHYPDQISGGEKQRVALTRALATEPELLLLDEPFSALDEKTRIRAHDELLRVQKRWKIPIIFITHQIDEAKKLANRIIYLEHGKITSIVNQNERMLVED